MLKWLNNILSVVVHPFLMTTYGMTILLYSDYPPVRYISAANKFYLLRFVFITTVILPFICLLVLLWRTKISSLLNLDQKERYIPYVFTLACNLVILAFFQQLSFLPLQIKLLPIMASTINLLAMLVNFKMKISIYATVIGFLTAFVCMLAVLFTLNLFGAVIVLVLLSGIICSLRLHLKLHTPKEIHFAYIISFVITVLFCVLIK